MTTKRKPVVRNGDRRARAESGPRVRRTGEPPQPRRVRRQPGTAPAPSREARQRSGPQTGALPRLNARPKPAKGTEQAKARAKARKAKSPKVIRPPLRDRVISRLASIDLRPRTLAAKVPFVVLIIGSLGIGLGITLWLSTDAAERSYQLGSLREHNRVLQQQKEALERDVLTAQSAPALAEEARNLGMIPSRDTAHLIQDPAGNWVVVGVPKPAEGVPPPPLNTKLPDEQAAPPPPARGAEIPVRVTPVGPAAPMVPGPAVPGSAIPGLPLPGLPVPTMPGVPVPMRTHDGGVGVVPFPDVAGSVPVPDGLPPVDAPPVGLPPEGVSPVVLPPVDPAVPLAPGPVPVPTTPGVAG
ncbi:hypothetical protein KIH27_05195 [Mycobacterium sp. M1]|uniref:Uncharacterized protein n=1 Tax=Mycolicibacter acidiphilus TaxID=2835306 RepID=A0ABS5RFE1_9MYCO|nr:hypothetical protein [Mycolicibacter acidiphilus]MBS9532983.1 hypothetical protein [Mycolicibacter acidiphilus]